jgi:hypothetical protein
MAEKPQRDFAIQWRDSTTIVMISNPHALSKKTKKPQPIWIIKLSGSHEGVEKHRLKCLLPRPLHLRYAIPAICHQIRPHQNKFAAP